ASNRITYIHPLTEKEESFEAPADLQVINGQRNYHPVILYTNGTYDDEDWFYRIIDTYNGEIVARYDRGAFWNKIKEKIAGVVLMSFENWKFMSERVHPSGQVPQYTFRTFLNQVQRNHEKAAQMDQNLLPECQM